MMNDRSIDEEEIKKYLARADTAIVYPEAVSEEEDDDRATDDDENDDVATNHSSETQVLKCSECDKTFPRQYILDEHVRQYHTPPPLPNGARSPPFMCLKCSESFPSKHSLEKHMALHSVTSQACKVCHKTFANIYRLQRHMISHDESSDLRKFKCPECGKAFKFKHHLKEHIRIHSGEKPFECPNCAKRFSHSGSYSSHMTSKKCWAMNMAGSRRIPTERKGLTSPQKADNVPTMADMRSPHPFASYTRPFLPAHALPHPFLPLGLNGFVPFQPYHSPAGHMLSPLLHGLSSPIPQFHTDFYRSHLSSLEQKLVDITDRNSALIRKFDFDQEEKSRTASASPVKDTREKLPDKICDDATRESDKTSESCDKDKPEKSENSDSRISDVDVSEEHDDKKEKGEVVKNADGGDQGANNGKDTEDSTISCKKGEQTDDISKIAKDNEEVKDGKTDIKIEIKDEPCDAGDSQNNCQFCHEEFASPVELHQHERYLCSKNANLTISTSDWKKKTTVIKPEPRLAIAKTDANSPEITELKCQYCLEEFNSAVEHHQHERYLCKKNTSLFTTECDSVFTAGSPNADSDHNSDDDCDTEDGDNDDKDKTRCRVRSMINDEQLAKLKAYYKINPRPKKYELMRIGNEIGFTKRVVQVWFQNMRARDRKRGKQVPYFPNMARSINNRRDDEIISRSPFIPIVPQFSRSTTTAIAPPTAHDGGAAGGVYMNSLQPQFPDLVQQQREPLDLSVKKQPLPAHSSPSSSCSTPGSTADGYILNLSTRTNSQLNTQMKSPSSCIDRNGNFCGSNSQKSPLSIDQILSSSASSHKVSNYSDDEDSLSNSSKDMLLDSSYSSTSGSMIDTMRSLGSMADFAEHGLGLMKKRPFSMVDDDIQLDYVDSLTGDDDQPNRKKRRSWKHHKVDMDEGMYACDQCDKMFSKQSSLARHKYEHSGARPFGCDICGKAFKHKHHLTEHKRLHSGEKPFQCKKCGKRFSHSGSYSQHMNHRYKYCKPQKSDDDEPVSEIFEAGVTESLYNESSSSSKLMQFTDVKLPIIDVPKLDNKLIVAQTAAS
ncbi:zinc finger protein 1-like [Tubulanus polymorphus]|uniref:zinc finger protein 1-like n=1 Tax=Tubulanus polymorphus TaxID=672921 RepID=UPI003DA29BD7